MTVAAQIEAVAGVVSQVVSPTMPTGAEVAAAPSARADATTSFGSMVSTGLEQVNQALLTSQQDMQNLAIGNVQSLHQVMVRLEESKIAFQLMLQVRNRVLESYQDIMRTQV
ncbi:flagellar hook-basal body complex protein FliE [Ralstonia sp. 24A2]|uniref:flagellar hook-basal body complex protein FliE n=1 Tax=Ralstonia sp. 24A2 TaxID=3447364 RepID=UPI003F69BD1C